SKGFIEQGASNAGVFIKICGKSHIPALKNPEPTGLSPFNKLNLTPTSTPLNNIPASLLTLGQIFPSYRVCHCSNG
ncbi:hypothetical protein, partial [Aeromonas hydrophila]|uniref:hypothetical protein n=1 Tax=Aeromonas hydrophila TaxID=644 RepID=UPI0036DCBBBF